MSPVMTCAWTTDLMTDYLEGALPLHRLLGFKLHLRICPRCRAFLASLSGLPGLVRQAFTDPGTGAAEAGAGAGALSKVLARIAAGEAKSPVLHPPQAVCEAFGSGEVDASLRMLLEVHLDRCATCRQAHPEHVPAPALAASGPPLPARLRDQVLPEAQWKWVRHGLRGARVAEIFRDPASQASLWLSYLPAGARFPDHRHSGQEAALILNGWIQDGPYLAGPGDFIQHEGGSEHGPEAEGDDGCWLRARTGPEGLRFSGWRRLFG